MNTLNNLVRFFVGAFGTVMVLAIPAFAGEKNQNVTIEKHGIVIHPGTKISGSDEKALNDVLGKYDKSLYRVETYKKGKLTKTVGELQDMYIDKKTASEVANAKAAGTSDSTVTFVSGPIQRTQKPPPRGVRAGKKEADELIAQLKPILAKYSKK